MQLRQSLHAIQAVQLHLLQLCTRAFRMQAASSCAVLTRLTPLPCLLLHLQAYTAAANAAVAALAEQYKTDVAAQAAGAAAAAMASALAANAGFPATAAATAAMLPVEGQDETM
jgi:hypothetical protein